MDRPFYWELLNFDNHSEKIIETYDSLNMSKNYPAANLWHYLFPIIEKYFKHTYFAVLYIQDKPIFILPISIFQVKKFFLKWNEVGFPFHKHINLIKLPNEIIQNKVFINELITLLKKHIGDNWSRFSIRHIEYQSNHFEYDGDLFYFKTLDSLPINEIVSKKHIRNIKRLEKKLAAENNSPILTINKPDIKKALDEFIEVEQESWKGKKGIAIYSDENLIDIYQSFTNNFTKEKMLVIKLNIGDKTIASAIGFHLGSTLFIHKISHLNEYSKFAPGNILILKLLEHSLKSSNIDELNLVTSPEWAKRWHPESRKIINITRFNNNISGRLLRLTILNWRAYKPLLKRLINAIKN